MFLAPRILRSRNIASDSTFPTRPIVAGSAHGVKLAKVFLGPILSAAHAASGVRALVSSAGLWTFVGDTVARAEGAEESVIAQIPTVGQSFARSFALHQLPVSPQTTVIASSPKVGKRIVANLRDAGIPASLAVQAVDLGCDTG
eukprot:5339383-Pyramimonas_sp.AAC.1